ncbi:MAG: hypothetical protein ACYTG4_12790, partial [Planctomycetota bacterium]
ENELELKLATPRLEVASLGDATTSIIARVVRSDYVGPFPLLLTVRDSVSGAEAEITLTFRGP